MKITGLDQITRQIEEAQRALKSIDGELGKVSFDPDDPTTIEAAVSQVNDMIDGRIGEFASNPIIRPMIDEMKERYRAAIIEKAAEARLNSAESEEL